MRTKAIFTINLLLLVLLVAGAAAQQVEFNYNGVVKVQGQPFDGEGQFKFTIVDKTGLAAFWANDGATLDGSEPTDPVLVDVVDGFFSVTIGDTETSGTMAPLYATMFNSRDRVKLRTWFSDGIGDFECLRPDREITNPAILGSQSHRETTIYVDPATGDDENTGLEANRPKQTIQSAWDSLPSLLQTTATISLAHGVYEESLLLKGKTTVGEAVVRILGDETSPTLVRLTNGDAVDPILGRHYAMCLQEQGGILIDSLQVEYCQDYGIWVVDGSNANLRNCVFKEDRLALYVDFGSLATARYCTARGNLSAEESKRAFFAYQQSSLEVIDCEASGYVYGFGAGSSSSMSVSDCIASNCTIGFSAFFSYLLFDSGSSTVDNCETGLHVMLNGVISYQGGNPSFINMSPGSANTFSRDGGIFNYYP